MNYTAPIWNHERRVMQSSTWKPCHQGVLLVIWLLSWPFWFSGESSPFVPRSLPGWSIHPSVSVYTFVDFHQTTSLIYLPPFFCLLLPACGLPNFSLSVLVWPVISTQSSRTKTVSSRHFRLDARWALQAARSSFPSCYSPDPYAQPASLFSLQN